MSRLISEAKCLGAPYEVVRACCGFHVVCREIVDDVYGVRDIEESIKEQDNR